MLLNMNQMTSCLLSKKVIKRITGVKQEAFKKMLQRTRSAWENASKRKIKLGRPHSVGGLEEHLLLLLMYYYCYCSYIFLASIFKTDETTIGRSIRRIEAIVNQKIALKRNPQMSQDTLLLILDATEQRVFRPSKGQKDSYSGKKKCHTIKTEMAIDPKKRILRISDSYPGKYHDFSIRKSENPFPAGVSILADSGYQGLQNLHEGRVILPKKSSKKQPLSDEDRRRNRKLSCCRVVVEHVFGSLKCFKILANRFRGSLDNYNQIFLNLAGIYNLSLDF